MARRPAGTLAKSDRPPGKHAEPGRARVWLECGSNNPTKPFRSAKNDSVLTHFLTPTTPYQSKQLKLNRFNWRKLVGVEPTCDTLVPHDGFEARARHRPSLASTAIIANRCRGSPAKATLEKHCVGSAFPRSSNGRTAAFGAVNRGSNPCRGATLWFQQLRDYTTPFCTDFVQRHKGGPS